MTTKRWNFMGVRLPLLLLQLAAELQGTSEIAESSVDQQTVRLRQPSLALSRTKRFEPEAGHPPYSEEAEEIRAIGKFSRFSGPTELQIAQARKLILQEGKDGDSNPSNLQEMDLDAVPLSSSSSFSFRLTNSSFLEALTDRDLFNSFSKLREVIDDEHEQEKGDHFAGDFASGKSSVMNETDSQTSVNDLIEKDKLLLAEMISKKTGFAFRTAEKGLGAEQGDRIGDNESQHLEAHIPAPPPLCPPGSGVCRSLRERLLEDLVTSYSDPFTSRIRYRLKRKPSVYTTRVPKTRNDIGIPDIYETEVTVMPDEAQNLPAISRSSEAHTHDPTAAGPDRGHHQVLAPQRPLLSLGAIKQRAREQSKANEAVKTRNKGANKSKARSKSRGRESEAAMRRYLARRGYGHPRLRTRTHLDYRRPVAFKFRRTNYPRNEPKQKITHGDAPARRLPAHPLQEKRRVEALPSDSSPRGALPQMTTRKHAKESPGNEPDVHTQESEEQYSKSENKYKKNSHEYQNVANSYAYEAPLTTTETSMLYKNKAPYHGSNASHETKNEYKVPHSHGYEISLLPHQSSSKSATVPGWLMDLKDVQRSPTSPHMRSKPKQPIITSSPMPADYALKASSPSALPPTYMTASPKRDLTREVQSKAHASEEQHIKSMASYSPSSTPDHFRIINPREEPARSRLNPPPPSLVMPLESKLLPSTNTGTRAGPTSLFPHYPVIPTPNKASGSKYSVKVTTPSGIYVTPVDVASPPHYGEQSRPIYAPPTSPKSTYGPPDDASYQSLKPHFDGNSHPYKAHISIADLRDHHENTSSHPIVTHLTPIKHEFLEHKVSRNSTTSHRVVVTPKTHHIVVTPKYPSASDVSDAPIHSPKSYTSAPVAPTTFKPSLPRNGLTQPQKVSISTSEMTFVKPPISTSLDSPPLHTPASQPKPRKEASNKKASPEISLVPYILEDYVTGHSYHDDYYDYYNNDYSYYFDDMYNYDYLLDVLGVAESRPLLPLHVLPDTFPKGQLQSFGYIAGVPGRAGKDYPVLGYIPDTSFGCGLVAEYPGYYADMDAGCQVFHVCHHDGTQDSYLCPNGTVFNQKYFVCDWWYNFNCEDAPFFYPVNAALSYAGLSHSGSYRDARPSLLRGTRGSNRPRRGQNTRPTQRRHLPHKTSSPRARPATRRQHALASTLHQVVLAPRRRAWSGHRAPAPFRRTPMPAMRLGAPALPYITRVPNDTRSLLGKARPQSGMLREGTWVHGVHNVTQIQE